MCLFIPAVAATAGTPRMSAMLSLTSLVRGSGGRLEFTGHGFLVISTVMEAQPGGGRVIRLVAEGLDPISLPGLELVSPDQLLGAVSRSIGLSNAQLALWDAVQGAYVALGEWSGRLPDTRGTRSPARQPR